MYLTLKLGDRLPSVALAQSCLLEAGAEMLAVDGIFGPKTYECVRRFQREKGLASSGRIEHHTWRALFAAKPQLAVEVIDASEITVLEDDGPYLDTGGSNILVNYGMSKGAITLIETLVAKYAPRSISLLRFHGHGGPGEMRIAGGGPGVRGTSSFAAGHFKLPRAIEYFRKLGRVMKPYGSMEFHGCRVGQGAQGKRLLAGIAMACDVPASAGVGTQYGGKKSDRFEGITVTHFPRSLSLKAWAQTAFNSCQ
ncbi:MAG: peptidoglycan-binding protein [Deltaproteobacteria bacterium]|nr:peptidoglycan-binding protein [Deltaproteobacteria bacterium]